VRNKKRFGIVIFFVIIIVIFLVIMFSWSKLNKIVTVEAGMEKPDVSVFLKDKKTQGTFATDMSKIDMNKPGTYTVEIQIGKKVYSSELKIEDTVAPTAVALKPEIWAKEEKEAKDFVENITDSTEVKSYFKEQPDFSKVGVQNIYVVLEDTSGNKAEVEVALTIKEDTEPPKIDGAHDQTIYIGDPVAYKKDIIVTDNKDKDLKLVVDSSAVDPKKAGLYKVIYTVTDMVILILRRLLLK
jgi:hypothetical protein